jgi:hypothetical protein
VSEIITGFGRIIHKKMEKMGFERYGFQTVFGFTDSIFVRHDNIKMGHAPAAAISIASNNHDKEYHDINQYLDDCERKLSVRLEHKNRFMFTIIFDKKNRYIAWTGNVTDRPMMKNLDGMSRRYPKWIKGQIEKIATHIVAKPNVDVIPLIKQAFDDLDYGRFEPDDMKFTEQLDKNPTQYPNDRKIRVKVLGLELGASKGEIVYWYESLANERGYSTKIKDLSIKKYKQILWDKIEDILEIARCNVNDIKSKLIYENEMMTVIYR